MNSTGSFTTARAMGVDAQLLLRNAARRMLFGAAELGGWNLLVPITAATMARTHYAKVIAGRITRTVEDEVARGDQHITDAQLGLRIYDALAQASIGFGRWLDTESQRNDRLFEIVERTRSAQGLAMELRRARVVEDENDTRWQIGEDPFVLAEALEAGAHWIASGNFKTLNPAHMERWLDRAQAQGRFPNVPRPFIIDPDTAIEKLLIAHEGPGGPRFDHTTVARALAHALSTPNHPGATLTHRIGIFSRFGSHLTEGGMGETGDAIRRWSISASEAAKNGKETEVWERIEEMRQIVRTVEVRRTREAEERRMALEQAPRPTRHRRRARTRTRSAS